MILEYLTIHRLGASPLGQTNDCGLQPTIGIINELLDFFKIKNIIKSSQSSNTLGMLHACNTATILGR